MNRHSLRQELANIYSFRGSPSLTRAKAIELTELFIINAGTRVGMDLDKSFHEFISDNISSFRKLLQDKVNLSGSFFQEFSRVLIDFFLSKAKKADRREGSAPKSKPQAAAPNKEID